MRFKKKKKKKKRHIVTPHLKCPIEVQQHTFLRQNTSNSPSVLELCKNIAIVRVCQILATV